MNLSRDQHDGDLVTPAGQVDQGVGDAGVLQQVKEDVEFDPPILVP